MKKEPIAYILSNIDAIYKAYIENDKKAKGTYEALKAVIPDIADCIEYNTFNSRVKPIMDTHEFHLIQIDNLNQVFKESETNRAELERVRQGNQEFLAELDALKQENASLKIDIQRFIEKDLQSQKKIESLENEFDRQIHFDDIQDLQKEDIQMQEVINSLVKDVQNLKSDMAILMKNESEKPKGLQSDLQKDLQEKKDALKLGKWTITNQNGYYKAVRNFGLRKDGKKDIQSVYLGKIYTEQIAIEKITAKGFPID